jgi:RNA recognition motif-containing protein
MSFTVFLGNLPTWVTADDIKSWLTAENLVADSVKVIRNPETQESKGFAFIEAPNADEMNSIIRRFDRAPLEDKLLRANPAQPPKGRSTGFVPNRGPAGAPYAAAGGHAGTVAAGTGVGAGTGTGAGSPAGAAVGVGATQAISDRPRRAGKKHKRGGKGLGNHPQSAFAEELAKAL